MTTYPYIMASLEKSFLVRPDLDIRVWGIKRVVADAMMKKKWGQSTINTRAYWGEFPDLRVLGA